MSQPTSSQPLNDNKNEREVIDPVTHLPIVIHDHVSAELEQIPAHPSKSKDLHSPEHHQKGEVADSNQQQHATLERAVHQEADRGRWHDPGDVESRIRIRMAFVAACAAAIGGPGGLFFLWLWSKLLGGTGFSSRQLFLGTGGCSLVALGVGACVLFFPTEPMEDTSALREKTETEEKEGNKAHEEKENEEIEHDSWLNALLHSLWPVVNPALFTSVSDMLEDALQASLPKLVHGVRVADIGQGSEPIRILGIRWLDAGKAGEETEGMQAEEGDFINLEVAFAYRARKLQGSGLKGRSSNAHLLMEFVIVGGVAIPVWVELTGMISTARMRIQLTPNPPFFSLMTLTLLGQPKITLICTPLAKNFFNVMDVPGLSGWVQRSIEAAVSEYVAPRSLHLDLKTLLMGKEQIDTVAVGVVIVTVRRATDFEQGDATKILKSRDGRNGDTYVTIGWSKWGKPLWSTRIIQSEGNPIWEETTALLVGPVEINSQERLRFQLWDCDRMTADDLLGTVDIPLKDLMDRSKNQFSARQDPLTKVDGSPQGTLSWEGGFFYKTTLQQHLEGRRDDVKELVQQIESQAEDKLREAKQRAGQASEIEQQKKEDLNEKTQKIIADSRPKHEWPSGVLTVKIEQIHGLEVQKIKESGVREEGEDEESEDLPSAYCTVIVNHQRVYRTRTKMKSEKPYFDASTEKFIRDWRNSIVIIAVRDARLHEADPLLGVVVLPLHHIFKHKSHINGLFPLVGGIGYGRMSLALTFRSVQAQLPRRLLGWDLGTLDIEPSVSPSLDLPADLASCKLIFRTLYGKGKMRPHQDGGWRRRRGRNLRLAVQKRYSSCLLIQFRKHALGPDKTLAFATLWLKDIPDNEEISVPLSVRKNEEGALERARANASYEIGERVGEITVKLRFWPGLSGYHQNLADKDANMADVMEALDSAEESKEIEQDMLPQAGAGSDSSSSSSSEDDGEEATLDEAKKHGVAGGIKEYRKKKGELHRKHRGLMQWRAARNLAWVARGVEHTTRKVGQKVSGTFKHQDHEIGIEKEV